jgi:hypothetical protein
MDKIKHNKFKNSGIIFELLIRQITSDTLSGKDSLALNLVKKYFSKGELAKEHKLYQALVNTKALSEGKAESLINATLEISSRLNHTALRKEKYNLIKEIRDSYNIEDFFKAKINNYKQHRQQQRQKQQQQRQNQQFQTSTFKPYLYPYDSQRLWQ